MGWAQKKANIKLQGNLRGEMESDGLKEDTLRSCGKRIQEYAKDKVVV